MQELATGNQPGTTSWKWTRGKAPSEQVFLDLGLRGDTSSGWDGTTGTSTVLTSLKDNMTIGVVVKLVEGQERGHFTEILAGRVMVWDRAVRDLTGTAFPQELSATDFTTLEQMQEQLRAAVAKFRS